MVEEDGQISQTTPNGIFLDIVHGLQLDQEIDQLVRPRRLSGTDHRKISTGIQTFLIGDHPQVTERGG